jgi:hypothetical protein
MRKLPPAATAPGHAAIFTCFFFDQRDPMANNFDPSSLWSPVALWTDLSLRALDMTMSSSQSLTEGVDRFARAGASVEVTEGEASTAAVSDRSAAVTSSGLALAVDLQRSVFDQMMRGWVQWMSTLGDFASLGAGLVLPSLGRQNPALELTRKVLLAAGESPATQARKGSSWRQPSGSRRASRSESESMEHAFASAEPKRRRSSGTSRSRPKSKARRSRGS